MKLLFLDESGNHALDSIDPQYPVFVLGGVIVDRTYYRTVVVPRVRQLKIDLFGDPGLILHTADIARTKNGFESLKDVHLRARFREAVNVMMRELDYTVVACVIDKTEHVARRGPNAADPYMYSLDVVVERLCLDAGIGADGAIIFAEKRSPVLDHQLDLAWERLKLTGPGGVTAAAVDERVVDLSLKDKRLNIAGLQLADLVVSPIGRAVMGKASTEDWAVVESKIQRGPGGAAGYGLVIRP